MTQVNSEQVIREHFEKLWNQGMLQTLEEYCLPEVELRVGEESIRGIDGFRGAASLILGAFPGIHFTIDDLVASPDRVAVRWNGRGTHQGPFMGIPPTGRTVSYWGISLYELKNGRIARQWGTADLDVVLAQLRGEKPLVSLRKSA